MPRFRADPTGRARRLALLAVLAALGLVAVVVAWGWERRTPPRVVGAPIRVTTPSGDAVFLLTHHETLRPRRPDARDVGRPRRDRTLHVELWRLDVPTGRVAWRRALLAERGGLPGDLVLLGAEDGTVWLFARGLRAVRASDGATLADSAQLRANNPALAGLLPAAARDYALRPDGMTMTAADGRVYRLDRATMAAQSSAPTPPPADAAAAAARRVVPAPYFTPAATDAFQERALAWPGHWLGVLTDAEAEAFRGPPAPRSGAPQAGAPQAGASRAGAPRAGAPRAGALRAGAPRAGEPRGALDTYLESMHGPPALNSRAPLRYRLWRAAVSQVSRRPADRPVDTPDDWGTRDAYRDIGPLPASAEFLMAGLLVATHGDAPIRLREPDGVLVLHRDRAGPAGRLMLTRIASHDGRTVWDATLPLGVLQSVLPGDETIVLFGLAPTSPADSARQLVVLVSLATGAVREVGVTRDE